MSQYLTDAQAKAAILDIGKRMYDRRYVAANDGNISVKTGDNRVWVTPTGVSKGFMTEDMLVCLDLDGNHLEGAGKASSETKMHLRVYKENSEVKAVVHAHPVTATAFAAARIPLDKAVMIETVIGLGVVPVADYALPGTQEVPDSIAPFCRDYNAVLLANHGAPTWGKTPIEAYYRMESLECSAEVMLKLGYLNRPAQLLTRSQVADLIETRKNNGVNTGGMPVCAEDTEREE